jgi:putative ABC transport system permease protein
VTGPGGRDGYINIADARELLRMEQPQAMEIAIRLKNPSSIDAVQAALQGAFGDMKTKQGQPALEIHTWEGLTPFANIARMIDIMTVSIKVMLVAIVLVSVMNVMLMAVYERIREIGTIAAIGTPPRKILWLFVSEGLLLGLVGTTVGTALSLGVVYALNVIKLTFNFGRQQIVLAPTVAPLDVIVVVLMVLAIAVLASLQPAWKASRMDPNTALRHV